MIVPPLVAYQVKAAEEEAAVKFKEDVREKALAMVQESAEYQLLLSILETNFKIKDIMEDTRV